MVQNVRQMNLSSANIDLDSDLNNGQNILGVMNGHGSPSLDLKKKRLAI